MSALGPLPGDAFGRVGKLLEFGALGSIDPVRVGARSVGDVAEMAIYAWSFCPLFLSSSWQGGLWPCCGGSRGGAA